MKILVIDNYDSFTYNLVQYIDRIGEIELEVRRNDRISLLEVAAFERIVISPGPGVPDDAGITKDLIMNYGSSKSILGVCLGHQSIAEVYGGSIRNLTTVYHGVLSEMELKVEDDYMFSGIPKRFDAGRYHSWIVEEDNLPECLEVTVMSKDGDIMALRHKEFDVRGVQFHPESILTKYGGMMLKNWIKGKS